MTGRSRCPLVVPGVFLVPYFIILVICGVPMLYMELAVGQYTRRGPIGALGQICPLFKGTVPARDLVISNAEWTVILEKPPSAHPTEIRTLDLPVIGSLVYCASSAFNHAATEEGAGLASVVISFLMSTYYNVIIAYTLYYFFTAFKSDAPWSQCNNLWNTPQCWQPSKILNISRPNKSRTPSEEFYE
uniref:Uncharacterized protein n=1 Tax=Timema tahoe TaxID=61484 RepID=A0A7R9NVF7_9NEOP|nr:unnamed protein product [Timema tahoe]